MISEQEALAAILAAVPRPEPETLPLSFAAGRFAARDIHAPLPLPGFDNSAMDGWAIHSEDCGITNRPLQITGEQPAGADRGLTVRPGGTVRIFTGAPLPAGTAAIVMQEDAAQEGETVAIREAAAPGDFIRRAGSDICAGQLIVRAGAPLTPQRIGVIAAQGFASVECGKQPRAAILCTGEELISPGEPLPHAGSLYNSNGPMLAALLESSRAAIPASMDTVRDELDVLTSCLRRRLDESDVLIIAGGVSVGDYDLVKPALQSLGIAPDFWRVSIRPGKPFLFSATGRKLIFGLPGNPVSAFVTALLFVLPALRRMAGASNVHPVLTNARASSDIQNKGDRTHYLRGLYDPAAGSFEAFPSQQSHAIATLSNASALARLEPDQSILKGDIVRILRLE
ncbi:MAG TPA: gephyrin-like molybdotransferase Glp [Verrucomicrobiales bacterium]|jgi:molybdopterin molybdotransferase|nr:gephyrin-like molybdotransferase Glp [Verrucomicrobiales bacterium]